MINYNEPDYQLLKVDNELELVLGKEEMIEESKPCLLPPDGIPGSLFRHWWNLPYAAQWILCGCDDDDGGDNGDGDSERSSKFKIRNLEIAIAWMEEERRRIAVAVVP
ncbi:hypothetical protein HDU76_013792 [Blyttiomyces sp. JEL0837]|nr:hypothetical protein HDU76_013792 [Blyttiomyces sp. JEL0837]